METTIPSEEWHSYDEKKKDNLRKAFGEGQFIFDNTIKFQPNSINNTISSADEIKKYKELLDMGLYHKKSMMQKKSVIRNLKIEILYKCISRNMIC